ncbi:MAG: lamin tail domain-containing protein [Candidatus Zixiibacteriota bacterium]
MNLRADSVSTGSCVSKYATILAEFFFALIFSLVFVPAAFSQNNFSLAPGVFINEVLANEPGSNTKLEWVELHNADSVEHDLEGWAFISKDDTTWIPAGTGFPARGFLILARKLLSDPPDSISFEGWWGDRSGTWGDSPDESFPAIEAKMSLTNSGGTVSLVDSENNVQTFTWDEDCGDGVSLERISADEDVWLCCVDSDRSTPGRKNSVSTTYSRGIELSIEPNPFSPDGDGFQDQAVFRYILPMESNLTIRIYDVRGRLIKTLVDDEPRVSGETRWDGKDDENRTVRIGIYVVLAEATGDSYSQKKATVVVAKR